MIWVKKESTFRFGISGLGIQRAQPIAALLITKALASNARWIMIGKKNKDYQFQLSIEGRAVSLTVVDMTTGKGTYVATMYTVEDANVFQGYLLSFVEEFSQGSQALASCGVMGNSSCDERFGSARL